MSEHYLEIRNHEEVLPKTRGLAPCCRRREFLRLKKVVRSAWSASRVRKSTLGRLVSRLCDATSGEIFLEGENILDCKGRRLKALRRKIQIDFSGSVFFAQPKKNNIYTIAEPVITQRMFQKRAAGE
jgi:ABC-type polar amino acid transport system ATPase subunit